jgi:hypothetical protein
MSTWRLRRGALRAYWTAVSFQRSPCILSLALSHLPPFTAYRQTPLRRIMLASSSPVTRLSSIQHLTMNAQELKNFLADSPPSTVNLKIKKHFEALTDQQARYAHYISRQVKHLITMSQENSEH